MYGKFKGFLENELKGIREAGLYKEERVIFSDQSAVIKTQKGEVINMCANNYLGLANNRELIEAAKKTLSDHGFGMSSVRFICGTQDIHKTLEKKISEFLHTEDTILYSSCFDANGGLFETLMKEEDVIISDELNHASIIDGIRLAKSERLRYKHADMADLEEKLKASADKRFKLIATDGVFSMDGDIGKLDEICDLADKYDALVMVDESHATGLFGKTGRGAVEYKNVLGRVDIITSTLGKALGGATGGFTTGKKEIIELLRQRSRPYLFSNTVAPSVVGAGIRVMDMLMQTTELRDRLHKNTMFFREKMVAAGFDIKQSEHPIVPIMLYNEKLAHDMSRDLLEEGIYVIGFSFPVVPKGLARIRVQISAAHTQAHLEKAIASFIKIGKKYNVIK